MQSTPTATWRSATFLPPPICNASFFYLTIVVSNLEAAIPLSTALAGNDIRFCQINYISCIGRRTTIHWQQHGQTHLLDAGGAQGEPTLLSLNGVGLRPLACRDCGFEYRRVHECLASEACSQVEVSAAGRSFVQRRPPSIVRVSYCVMRWQQ